MRFILLLHASVFVVFLMLAMGPSEAQDYYAYSTPLFGGTAVAPGASFQLYLNIADLGDPTDLISAFTMTLDSETDVTTGAGTSLLPAGWTSSFTNNSFTAQNVSGSDLTVGQITNAGGAGTSVGFLDATVSPSATGSVVYVPGPISLQIYGAQGQTISASGSGFTSVPFAPEPPIFLMVAFGLMGLELSRRRFAV